jgi:hypothetical protein
LIAMPGLWHNENTSLCLSHHHKGLSTHIIGHPTDKRRICELSTKKEILAGTGEAIGFDKSPVLGQG